MPWTRPTPRMNRYPRQALRDGDVTFEPVIKDSMVGYRCEHANGRVEYLYFNISTDQGGGGPEDGPGNNVFVYQGEQFDPAEDEPCHFYYVFDERDDAAPLLQLGPRQANVVIDALTELAISLSDDAGCERQRIASNLRDRLSRRIRKLGWKSNW